MVMPLFSLTVVFAVLALTFGLAILVVSGRSAKQLFSVLLLIAVEGAILAPMSAAFLWGWGMSGFGPHPGTSTSYLWLYAPATILAFLLLQRLPRPMFYLGIVGSSLVPISFLSEMSLRGPEQKDWRHTLLLASIVFVATLLMPPRSRRVI